MFFMLLCFQLQTRTGRGPRNHGPVRYGPLGPRPVLLQTLFVENCVVLVFVEFYYLRKISIAQTSIF